MDNLGNRERRIVDLSKVRDGRFKGAGIFVSEDNGARCSSMLCEWVRTANSAHGGTSPFPYGFYVLDGELAELKDPPEVVQAHPFKELIPCDRADRRAVKLTWNERGTEANFGFAPMAAMLGIDAPKGTTLWIEAIPCTGTDGKPVMVMPVGDHIQQQAVEHISAGKQDGTGAQG